MEVVAVKITSSFLTAKHCRAQQLVRLVRGRRNLVVRSDKELTPRRAESETPSCDCRTQAAIIELVRAFGQNRGQTYYRFVDSWIMKWMDNQIRMRFGRCKKSQIS